MSTKTPEKQIDLSLLPCHQLSGVGQRIAERLKRLNIDCVQDLLFHLPLRYQNRTELRLIRSIVPGDSALVEGVIIDILKPKGGKTRAIIRIQDHTGYLSLRFFHMSTAQQKSLQLGIKLRCFGEVRLGAHGLEMVHPEYRVGQFDLIPPEEHLTPVYPTTEGISQFILRKLTQQALQLLNYGAVLQDILPTNALPPAFFPSLKEALHFVHRPPPNAPIDLLMQGEHLAQKRLGFEELLAHRLSLLSLKKQFQLQAAPAFVHTHKLTEKFLQQLPFALTAAQERVGAEINKDLSRPHPMLRLVQGDVGSGKTVIAALAALQAVENNYQVAILAPTELLAEQHFKVFEKWFTPLQIQIAFLSGQLRATTKRDTLESIRRGSAQVIVGTHAIFQRGVEFAKLALIIVDEQHRFGVEQRAMLREKGIYQPIFPHQLMMTATPIPRTLAMSAYADLDYSAIDELPPGRTPITTSVISNERRKEVIERIRAACGAGRQVYWVCTLISESEVLQCQTAEQTAAELNILLPEFKIALLHGQMKSADKETIMHAFKQGEIDLLVATTVIEVGVDVPNASLMVIENAERLGLAQLHQLRGRVGRGTVASYCLLLYQSPLSYLAQERLKIMRETTDGFKIAQRDLELRGPGEVLGTRQTGDITFRIADLVRDSDLLPHLQQAANLLQSQYPESIELLIKRWLKGQERFGRV